MGWIIVVIGALVVGTILTLVIRDLRRPAVSAEERARRLPFETGGFIDQRRLEEILGTASLAIMTAAREKAAFDARKREVDALKEAKKAKTDRETLESS